MFKLRLFIRQQVACTSTPPSHSLCSRSLAPHWILFYCSIKQESLYQCRCESYFLFFIPSTPPTSILMSTVQEIQHLVRTITALSNSLPKSVPNGNTKDKIWTVMHSPEGETTFETFNKRFDALFGEDCRVDGRLHFIRQGKNGMGLVCAYLNKLDWTDFPLDLAEIKLKRLSTELAHLRYVSSTFIIYLRTNNLIISGARMQMSSLSPPGHRALQTRR